MTKKAKQLLSILGRNNATYDCIARTQEILDTKKNAREVLDKITTDILFLKSLSEAKINKSLDFINNFDFGIADFKGGQTKICKICLCEKDLSAFSLIKNKDLKHTWCIDCRREYYRKDKQRKRG